MKTASLRLPHALLMLVGAFLSVAHAYDFRTPPEQYELIPLFEPSTRPSIVLRPLDDNALESIERFGDSEESTTYSCQTLQLPKNTGDQTDIDCLSADRSHPLKFRAGRDNKGILNAYTPGFPRLYGDGPYPAADLYLIRRYGR